MAAVALAVSALVAAVVLVVLPNSAICRVKRAECWSLSSRVLVLIGVGSVALLGLLIGTIGFVQLSLSGPMPAAMATPNSQPTIAPLGTPMPAVKAEPTPHASSPALASPTPAPSPAPNGYDHIVLIVLENHSFESVIGSPQAPFLNSLATQWSLATGYTGVSSPSLPNYLAMIGGDTFGISSNCTDCFVNAPSLPDRLEASGKSWKAYMEGMPSPCFVGSFDLYAQKHNPFIYFDPIRTDRTRCSRIVPYGQLAADFSAPSRAPNFAFITPDMCNDGHDCSQSMTDAWLAREVPRLLSSPGFSGSRSLLVITYDEGDSESDRVATILAGSGVKHGFRSADPYDHYSLLRTVESLWGLAPVAAGDGAASPMSDFFES